MPFDQIAVLRPVDDRRCELVLRSGTTLLLGGSNDVNEDNRGILIAPEDGETVELQWSEVARVELD